MKEQSRWTQWQALQWGSLRNLRRKLTEQANEAFEDIIPLAEQKITEAYHDAQSAYDKEMIKEYTKAGLEVPWERLPVYEPEQHEPQKIEIHIDEPAGIKEQQPKLDVEIEPIQVDDESFFQINEEKLQNIIEDVKTDMNIARYSAIERANAQYAEVLHRVDAMLGTGSITLEQAIEIATEDLARMGLNSVQYKDGRRVNTASYAEMALRTSQHRAVLQAEGVKRDQWGDHLVVSAVLHSTCPICQKWQGVVLVDDVYASGKPDGKHIMLSTAIADGFLHPNCRHPLATYIEGITQIPKQSDLDQTKSNYDAEQKQRQIELQIRRWKRKEALAQTEKSKKEAANKIKQWQEAMRKHLKKNSQLRRNPQREKLMGLT